MHPNPDVLKTASRYLSVSLVATDCIGFKWPCRLFEVQPVGKSEQARGRNKVACEGVKVIREMPAHDVFGPQGQHVVALIEQAKRVTPSQVARTNAAWDDTNIGVWNSAWYEVDRRIWGASRLLAFEATPPLLNAALEREDLKGSLPVSAFTAATEAVKALMVRDLVKPAEYDALTRVWRLCVGRIHPNDAEVKA